MTVNANSTKGKSWLNNSHLKRTDFDTQNLNTLNMRTEASTRVGAKSFTDKR